MFPYPIFNSLFLILFIMQGHVVTAQIILTDTTDDFYISAFHMDFFEDTTREITFQQVQHAQFGTPGSPLLKNTHPSSAYWIRFTVQNLSEKNSGQVLEALTPNLYLLELWIPDSKEQVKKYTTGLSQNRLKSYSHKNYVFDLPSDIESYTVYIRVLSPNITGLEFKIHSRQAFMRYALNEYLLLGIYYGILLIMLVYNMLVFLTNRERVYLFYCMYLMSCIFLSLSEDGLGVEHIWQRYATINIYFCRYLAPSLFLISFVLYARSFLNLSQNFPLASKTALAGALLFPGANIIRLLSGDSNLFNLEDYYLVPFLIVFAASVYIYLKGYKSARFFIIGYITVFICMVVLQLRLHRIIESNIFTVYIFNFGVLIETVILSFALADRLRMIRREKQKSDQLLLERLQENSRLEKALLRELREKNELSEKVNRELEDKVQQRTEALLLKTGELTKANEKLAIYSQKLTDMNIQLDLDNWHLKKEVKKERTARIIHEELSYEDFSKTFADNNTCLRYLENQKWASHYRCKKCGHEKYTSKIFSRKCTRCNYIESPTAHTLFHGIKIPLNKAFFIVYASNCKGKKMTLEEMSTLLDIGKNTCWDFRKKIKARMVEKKKSLRVNEVESWEVLIPD